MMNCETLCKGKRRDVLKDPLKVKKAALKKSRRIGGGNREPKEDRKNSWQIWRGGLKKKEEEEQVVPHWSVTAVKEESKGVAGGGYEIYYGYP